MKELLIVTLCVVVVFAICLGLATLAGYFIGQASCSDFANQNPQFQFKYTIWNGCLVKLPNGVWLSATKMNWVNGELKIEK